MMAPLSSSTHCFRVWFESSGLASELAPERVHATGATEQAAVPAQLAE